MKRALALTLLLAGLALPAQASAYGMPAETQRVKGAQIAAVADLAAARLVDGVDRIVQPAFTVVDQMVRPGSVTIALGAAQINPTYITIPVKLSVDGQVEKTAYVGYRVLQTMVTAVSTRDLTPGVVLAKGDVTLARVPSTFRAPVEAEALVGRKVITTVPKGKPLFVELTTVNEIVKAGQPCIFVVHDGRVALTADVIARTGGGLGELVAVWNPQTNRALSGTVTAPGRVELTLPGNEPQ